MTIRLIASLLGFAALSAVSAPALAARTGVGLTITDITIIGTDARIFISSGISGTTPACGNTRPNHFAIDVDSNKGRALLNLATAAMLSGKSVNVTGLDTCAVMTSYQTLDQLTLNN